MTGQSHATPDWHAPDAGSARSDISISVVSHLQLEWVAGLMTDLEQLCADSRFELILTLNQDEALPFALNQFSYPVKIIRNKHPLGFGANHNQAFHFAESACFCVINPDIRLTDNPFPVLLAGLKDSSVGVVAPFVVGNEGAPQDSARRFPTPLSILRKVRGMPPASEYPSASAALHPDWVAGMFMLFPSHIFEKIGGFDERYFLYYEDVDICARLRLLAYEVLVCAQTRVLHEAQRHSHRNMRYLRWHLQSMLRFFLSPVYRRIRKRHLVFDPAGRN